METCLYMGKQICAYDVMNSNLALNYELKKEWKLAGDAGLLICEECGNEVFLKVNDPNKKVPHFAHRFVSEHCYYNDSIKESEEHRRGKMLIYNHFKEHYPQLKPIINYKFPNKRRADVYIEFEDNQRLAVEFQRTYLDFNDWKEKQEDYNELGIDVLWLLRGNEEGLMKTEKQIEVAFFQQVMLNEHEKVAVHLDVANEKLVLAKNMRYSDPYIEDNDFEELFIRPYNLKDVVIKPDGQIQCDFIDEYKIKHSKFINTHVQKCLEDEIERNEEEENEQKEIEAQEASDGEVSFETNSIIVNRYCRHDITYKEIMIEALKGDEAQIKRAIYKLINGCSEDLKVMEFCAKYLYLMGNEEAVENYTKIVLKAGDYPELEVRENSVHELRCPYCGGRLVKEFGEGGTFLTCSDNLCKFAFGIQV